MRDWLGELPQGTASETRKQRAAREQEELRAAREAQQLDAERLALAQEVGGPGMSDLSNLSAPEHTAAGGKIKFYTGDVSKFALPPASFDAGLCPCCVWSRRICDYSRARVFVCAQSWPAVRLR